MMRTTLFGLLLLLLPRAATAQAHLVEQKIFDAVATEFSGQQAHEYVRHIIQYHRIQGSPMMAEAAERVVLHELRRAGLDARLESFPSDGKTRYQGHVSPMGWSIKDAELWLEGEAPVRLCRYRDVPMCVSTYSRGGPFAGELVEVGRGTKDSDYAGRDVRGKIALAHGYAASVVRNAVLKHGAAGVVIYPDPADRPGHPDMVHYNGIWPEAKDLPRTSGGFQISQRQYDRIRALMARGPVRVRGFIDATLGPGAMTLVHATIPGDKEPDKQVLLTAHLDHPKWSANDNASGAGALIELARSLVALIRGGKVPRPRRTLHFLWVPEFSGTYAYVAKHPEIRRCGAWDDPRLRLRQPAPAGPVKGCVVANLNLDMVGEDTEKTGSRFYMTRTPASVPSFLDALLLDVLQQVREAGLYAPTGTRHPFRAEVIPYAPDSDHDILLSLGVPASMFGHAPDWTHHTSEDTLDKLDPSELLRVGVLAGAASLWLASAGEAEAARLWPLLVADRIRDGADRLGLLLSAAPAGQAGQGGALAAVLRDELARDLRALQPGSSAPAGPFPEAILRALQDGPRDVPRDVPAAPRRLQTLPLPDDALRDLPAADQAWIDEQKRRFDEGAGGQRALREPPQLRMLIYETINLLDGRRGPAEIAQKLSLEFMQDIDAAWVERLLRLLSARKLIHYGN
jgi:hypothetical protein